MTMNKITVAFDIDGVWDTHKCWLYVYTLLINSGFRVIFVTGRKQPQEKLERLRIPSDAVIIISEGILKKEAALRAGYDVDIWIDDNPGTIEKSKILDCSTLD